MDGRRRIAVALVAVLALAALVFLWLGGSSPDPDPDVLPAPSEATRKVVRKQVEPMALDADAPIDPETLEEAARGELGLALRNRVCALCEADALPAESCKPCREVREAGRVNVDVVGTDGRPFPDHDVMVGADCGKQGSLGSGFLDLPEGKCVLSATRVEGPFDVHGEAVTVDVVAGEETYLLLEIPSEEWGGVGVTLRAGEDGIVVEGLLDGAAATGMIPQGAVLLGVDGELVEGLSAREAGLMLAGPAGTEVEVQIGYDLDGEWVEDTITVPRKPIAASEVSVTAGAPG